MKKSRTEQPRSHDLAQSAPVLPAALPSLTLLLACLLTATPAGAQTAPPQPAANDYPTSARVEYVGECMARHGGAYVYLHKCSCAIDRIAAQLPYDEYVEFSTFAKYATLSGERGGIFRDADYGKQSARRYRSLEGSALQACGVQAAAPAVR